MSVTLQTAPNRIEFLVYGQRFASYCYGGALPGFVGLLAPEGRPLTQPDTTTGLTLWIGHGDVNGIAFGAPEQSGVTSEADGSLNVGQILTTEMLARRGSQSVGFQQECAWTAPDKQYCWGFPKRRVNTWLKTACCAK